MGYVTRSQIPSHLGKEMEEKYEVYLNGKLFNSAIKLKTIASCNAARKFYKKELSYSGTLEFYNKKGQLVMSEEI